MMTAPWNFAPTTMLSDVIDYDLWSSRTNKAGAIFALNTLLVKATMAIGAGGAFALLDRFHYHAGHPNTGSGEVGLVITYLVIPGVFHLLSAAAGWRFPLDARRQTILRRRLDSLRTRATNPA
jgi:Na+/melibiose symporter-like transporter